MNPVTIFLIAIWLGYLTRRKDAKKLSNNEKISVRKIFKNIFNSNTGYFIKEISYSYKGIHAVGYVLCKGYIMFGIPGYDRIGVYLDKQEALQRFDKIQGGEQ